MKGDLIESVTCINLDIVRKRSGRKRPVSERARPVRHVLISSLAMDAVGLS